MVGEAGMYTLVLSEEELVELMAYLGMAGISHQFKQPKTFDGTGEMANLLCTRAMVDREYFADLVANRICAQSVRLVS